MVTELNGVRYGKETVDNQIAKAAWSVFVKEMADKQYGYEPTLTAWCWFYHGWTAHIKGPRHVK